MANEQSNVIVGVFENHARAEEAYNALRQQGFGQDYLGLADPRPADSNSLDQLEQAGIPKNEADFYQQEFSKGRSLVTVRAGGLQPDSFQKARNILKQFGAYDAPMGQQGQQDYGSNITNETPSPYFDLKRPRREEII